MVATRGHPAGLPEPTESPSKSPTKRSLRSSAIVSVPSATANGSPKASSPSTKTTSRRTRSSVSRGQMTDDEDEDEDDDDDERDLSVWAHTPSKLTIFWLAVSLPLVIWDTGYVLLRPYSMPGGSLHYPIWVPYELYGTVDHMYGFKQWNLNNGWTAAQGSLNAVETGVYLFYLYLVYKYGHTEENVKGRGAPDVKRGPLAWFSESRTVEGRVAAWAVLLMFSASLVTFAKTVLYWLIEVFSGFDNIGHNTAIDLVFLWIIPNGAWLAFPGYLIYVFGAEILQGLDHATAARKSL